jgi:hypothetical protein
MVKSGAMLPLQTPANRKGKMNFTNKAQQIAYQFPLTTSDDATNPMYYHTLMEDERFTLRGALTINR